jgi:hypothetical protein
MEKFNRAVRRHHVARLKHTRKHYWGYPTFWPAGFAPENRFGHTPQEMSPSQLGKVVQYPQACSCMGCGNQRHNTGGWMPTLQERRWFQQYREQLDELNDVE